ncbi:sodium/proline symporter PutP [Cetobacterium sp. 8H]|uniref:sodium/proline symporter PutP n=1 Tax=Cetobacterium sp. 8H TaxID=2759681 RepID=UPI00163BCD60|nr:sodium/proline symporter PutP [Cetobacterium sp. 8H]MBC2850714.1 sodium/proline symporter PutP [Cetobacterium sp. 8H]
MIGLETFITFGAYLVFLIGVGVYFYGKTTNSEEYLIGGRGVGSWVTALSAQASDMSGWLLMGLPGAVYLSGFSQIWVVIGLTTGTYLNWKYIAPKLRVETEVEDALTLPTFLEKKLNDKSGLIRNFLAFGTLFFFTIYSSSGLVAAGKLFETILGIEYKVAVIIGALTIVVYTFLGGYLASCWTDFFQGALMFVAIIAVPVMAFLEIGSVENVRNAIELKEISLSIFKSGNEKIGILSILSSLAWGLGYFGQPHILVRFMSIKDVKELKKSRRIAMVWVIISLIGAISIGLLGIPIFSNISSLGGDAEKIFIFMIKRLFNPWIVGIMLAAILSAIMSTIDSQLLVSSTTLTEDFYRYIKKDATDKEIMWVGRACIIVIAFLALLFALNQNSKILSLVAYAWGGFGTIFGPAIILVLYVKNIQAKSILSGIVVGTLVFLFWKILGLDAYMYELLPGFIANLTTSYVMDKILVKKFMEA